MNDFIIGLVENKAGRFYKVIQFFTRGKKKNVPTHCFIVAGKCAYKNVIIEATEYKIIMATLSKYINEKCKLELYRTTKKSDFECNKAISLLMSHVGENYSYLQFVGYLWVWFGKLIGKDIKNPFGKKSFVCSDFVAEGLANLNYSINVYQDNILPQDIKDFCEGHKDFKKISVEDI